MWGEGNFFEKRVSLIAQETKARRGLCFNSKAADSETLGETNKRKESTV